MVTRLRENDNKHAAALQKEKDEVSRLKRELAKVQEERANYEKAVAAADKQELREKLEMAEVSTTSAVEAFDALEAKRARWLIELNRIDHVCPRWSFTLSRFQFPVRVCYGMTIDKSWGQSLLTTCIYHRRAEIWPAFLPASWRVGLSIVMTMVSLRLGVRGFCSRRWFG